MLENDTICLELKLNNVIIHAAIRFHIVFRITKKELCHLCEKTLCTKFYKQNIMKYICILYYHYQHKTFVVIIC